MIRPPQPADTAGIAALYNRYVRHSTATFETQPLSEEQMGRRLAEAPVCFVCERQGAVAGFCYAHAWKQRSACRHTLEATVYVAPEYTGQGIGRRLVEQLVEACRTAQCHALIACITADNRASRRLFEAAGFRCVSHFEQVGRKFDRWLDVVDYELLL